ncbi:MAG: manganese efflux pump MntP family protein [Bacteroidales bacterium]|nr:manganese efflux pump MntP family protein [Bacteroidales bacterium]
MLETILIALALAMDCFAVSAVCGVIIRRFEGRVMLPIAFFFGLFQGLMPLIGWALTSSFSHYLEAVDHWIAFGMLAVIGGKMIADSFKAEEDKSMNPRNLRTQLLLAVATSIDALAVGISYACTGYQTIASIAVPVVVIGIVSFMMSLLGFTVGVKFGEVVVKKLRPELLGGIILIGIGVKILIEHLS